MLDLITVVYQKEIPLLQLQAKSIDVYFQKNQIKSIYIIVNDHNDVVNLIDCKWWGKFADCVNVIPFSIFGYVSRILGWENQQLLKLLAAARCTCDWSCVLDAKTLFVKNVTPGLLIDSDNRACANNLSPQPVFESAQHFVENFFQITLDKIVGPAGVPFLFHTKTVQELIAECEARSGQPFTVFFQENVCYPNLITEFYLYSGFVKFKYGTLNELYAQKQRWNCINVADWQIDSFDQLFLDMQKFLTLTVSVATKTWVNLPEHKQLDYCKFLQTKKIVLDLKTTQELINNYINSSDLNVDSTLTT